MIPTGCTQVLNSKLTDSNIPGGIEHMYEELCATIYPQMTILETINDFNETFMDLAYEDALICGIIGYQDFLSIPRLLKLLKRQFPSGCYGHEHYNPKMRYVITFSRKYVVCYMLFAICSRNYVYCMHWQCIQWYSLDQFIISSVLLRCRTTQADLTKVLYHCFQTWDQLDAKAISPHRKRASWYVLLKLLITYMIMISIC